MNEYRLRQKMVEDKGLTWDEADAELSRMAEDSYDRWRDEQAERLADERANNVRSMR